MKINDAGIKPIGKQILLRSITEDKTEGGILLPESARIKKGLRIEALGDEVKKNVKVGEFVAVDARGLANIKYDGVDKNVILCHEDAVLAVIKK